MAEKDRFRTKDLRVKLTEREREILEEKCELFNLTKSCYIRHAILYGYIKTTLPRVDENLIRQLIKEVNDIGNNINQIAYICNERYTVEKEEMIEAKNALFDGVDSIVTVLRGIEE